MPDLVTGKLPWLLTPVGRFPNGIRADEVLAGIAGVFTHPAVQVALRDREIQLLLWQQRARQEEVGTRKRLCDKVALLPLVRSMSGFCRCLSRWER
jgi:hypothetical protein